MLPDPAGIEPMTWSQVRRASNWAIEVYKCVFRLILKGARIQFYCLNCKIFCLLFENGVHSKGKNETSIESTVFLFFQLTPFLNGLGWQKNIIWKNKKWSYTCCLRCKYGGVMVLLTWQDTLGSITVIYVCDITFVISCLLTFTPSSFEKWVYSKKKAVAPNAVLLEYTPVQKWGQTVSSFESLTILLYIKLNTHFKS